MYPSRTFSHNHSNNNVDSIEKLATSCDFPSLGNPSQLPKMPLLAEQRSEDGKTHSYSSLAMTPIANTNPEIETCQPPDSLAAGVSAAPPLVDPHPFVLASENNNSIPMDYNESSYSGDSPRLHDEMNTLVLQLKGDTALHQAVKNGNIATTYLLIEEGADPNAVNGLKQTTLHLAAERGFTKIVELLLAHHVAVDAYDAFGFTALHLAAQKDHRDIVKLLLDSGIDIECRTKGTVF